MRVIKTEMYFDDIDLPDNLTQPKNPGICVAWIKAPDDDAVPEPSDFRALQLAGDEDPFPLTFQVVTVIPPAAAETFSFLANFALWNTSIVEAVANPTIGFKNADIARFLADAEIIIERSPPEAVPLSVLLARGGPITIGTFIGLGAAIDHPLVAFVTVPAGIIIISSAVGIAKAFEAGLNKAISRLFEQKKQRRTRSSDGWGDGT
jgi:hypothetical protein